MARIFLHGVSVSICAIAQQSSTTIATAGAYAVVVATALPTRALALTSAYLAEPGGDIAASHLLIAGHGPSAPRQRVLPGRQAGETHARMCLLDHAAELQAVLHELTDQDIAIDITPEALARADAAWDHTP